MMVEQLAKPDEFETYATKVPNLLREEIAGMILKGENI